MHACKPKIQHVLIWAENNEALCQKIIEYLMLEFEGNIYPFTIESIPTIIEKINPEDISSEIEKYDFHVIKACRDCLELVLVNNERHVLREFEDFEEAVEEMARKVLNSNI